MFRNNKCLAISMANFKAVAGFSAPFLFKNAQRSPWNIHKNKFEQRLLGCISRKMGGWETSQMGQNSPGWVDLHMNSKVIDLV